MKRLFAVLVVLAVSILGSCKREYEQSPSTAGKTDIEVVSGGEIPGSNSSWAYIIHDTKTNQCFAVVINTCCGSGVGITQAKCNKTEAAR
jgi:hypothetical protein